tara:strand:+ start:1093 stop:1269 length:177 start_codon:yes stop_codon:yes gene_type:complete
LKLYLTKITQLRVFCVLNRASVFSVPEEASVAILAEIFQRYLQVVSLHRQLESVKETV